MIERTLPRSFEDFNEARKRGFLAAKEYKEQGGKLAGCLCSYTPLEVIDAAGMAAIGLCGMSDEVIPDAETVLPKNLCPLIKCSYGFAHTEKCPYFYFSDLIVGETTCDGKKKMYEMLGELKDLHRGTCRKATRLRWAATLWREEVDACSSRSSRTLRRRHHRRKAARAVRLRNRNRLAAAPPLRAEAQADRPPWRRRALSTLLASSFNFDV